MGLCPKRWGWGLWAGGGAWLSASVSPTLKHPGWRTGGLQRRPPRPRDRLWTQGPPLPCFPGALGPTLAPEWRAWPGTGCSSAALGPLICWRLQKPIGLPPFGGMRTAQVLCLSMWPAPGSLLQCWGVTGTLDPALPLITKAQQPLRWPPDSGTAAPPGRHVCAPREHPPATARDLAKRKSEG